MKRFAKGRTPRRIPGTMNGLESKYAQVLEQRKRDGEIADWWYECYTFKLAKDTRFTPDFMVMLPDGVLEAHETKGFFRDDAKVKIKVAAEKFPFVFRLVTAKAKKNGGGWNEKVIGGAT
jgi:hypothetical protein